MERVISSCSAKIPCISRSYVSDQIVNPSPASISSAVIRTRLPSRRTLPSSTCPTFNLDAISPSSASLSLNQNEDRRAATRRPSTFASAPRSSSAIPSPKYAWSLAGLKSLKGKTAMDFSSESTRLEASEDGTMSVLRVSRSGVRTIPYRVRSKNQESTSATGNPSTISSTVRRTTQFGISNTEKTCEIPTASAQPPTTYATATVKTLRLFSSSKNSLGSMAICPKLSPFQRSFTTSTVNDQVARDLPHRLGKLHQITVI